MTKKNKPLYKITQTLLNSWGYMFNCDPDYADKAQSDFIKTLKREKTPPNIYMQRGIKFEEDCVNGKVPIISDIIKNGAYQVYGEKDVKVYDLDVRILGYADVVKEGVVYDIKRVTKYDLQKYFYSYQHHIYLDLFPEAKKFVYLIGAGYNDDYLEFYAERYLQDEKQDVVTIIENFFDWLIQNDLFEIYKEHWLIEN